MKVLVANVNVSTVSTVQQDLMKSIKNMVKILGPNFKLMRKFHRDIKIKATK